MRKLAQLAIVLAVSGCVVVVGQRPGPEAAGVPVPSVVGMVLSEARTRVEARGLRLGQVKYAPGAPGVVIVQSPAPGRALARGAAVYLTVGSPRPAAVAAVVPQVTGLRLEDARRAIEGAGLRVGKIAFFSSPAAADRTVVSQSPQGGTSVARASRVELRVSLREESVAVPNVVGMTLAEATATVVASGLTVGGIESVNVPGIPTGQVASQRPRGGSRTRPGSVVSLKISTGLTTSVVPNVVGFALPEATRTLAAAGLSVAGVSNRTSSLPKETIVSQSPEVGALLPRGSGVSLVLSAGRGQVAVPPVVGLDLARAERALRASSLEPGRVLHMPGRERRGTVIAQSPEPGTLMPEGSRVNLTVSSGTAKVLATVPGLIGMTQAQAVRVIAAAGLSTGNVTTRLAPRPGRVISQSPAAGSRVAGGTAVDMVVATTTAAPGALVPGVVGMKRHQALRALALVGLSGRVTLAPGKRDVVLSQDPAAGTRAAAGSAVQLTVGTGAAQPMVTVPNVVRMKRQAAEARLKNAGLVAGEVTTRPGGRKDFVASQSPTAGARAARGSAVGLTVWSGARQQMVSVPSVVGMKRRAAEARLKNARLVAGEVSTRPGGRKDVVASQDPAAGARVSAGSRVSLVVWTGGPAAPAKVRVPQLVGMEMATAMRSLRTMGLTSRTSRAPGQKNVVLKHSPAAGTMVAPGSTVQLTVGSAARQQTLTVPNVVGAQRRAAEARLRAAGLVVGQVSTRPGGRKDVVATQNPAAGAAVPRGTQVSLVVWSGAAGPPAKVSVPGVVGMTLTRAQTAVGGAGLVVGRIERRPGGQPGVVMEQSPAAGTQARTGSRVNLVVGAEATGARVPQLVGMNLNQAQAMLRQAGLAAGRVTRKAGGRKDRVASQSPRAGTLAAPGGKVNLEVYSGPAGGKTVPSVVGKSVPEAQRILREAGCKAQIRRVNWGRKNVVASQSPRAGTAAAEGATVVIYVGK